MSIFDVLGDAAKAVGHAVEGAVEWVGDRASDVGGWFGDLFEGNIGEQAVPQSELVKQIMASKGAPDWHGGADQAAELAEQHAQVSGRVQQLMSGMESSWTGGGADAAQARIKPLADVSQAASQTFTANSQNASGLAHGFDQLKASLRPMPETPPHRTFLDEAQFWRTTDTEAKINQYNEIAQQNLDKYNTYADTAKSAGQGLKIDYGQLQDFGDGNVDISSQPQEPVDHRAGPGNPHLRSGGHQPPVAAPGTGGHAQSLAPPPPPSAPAQYQPPARDAAGLPHYQPGSGPGDGTTTAGWTPPAYERPNSPGWTPPALPNAGAGTNSGNPSPGFVAGFGPAGGFGPTGGLPGTGSGSPGGSAGGRAGGSAGPGAGSGAAEEPVARGGANSAAARGAAGAKGTPGMGGMAGGGKGGKGEEDKEHQRKYGLDDDSAFDLTDDEDGRLRDPRTGLPPTPPTIGG
ncbi:hypothetical protein ACWEHA_06550 [Amycolatopsis nivea]